MEGGRGGRGGREGEVGTDGARVIMYSRSLKFNGITLRSDGHVEKKWGVQTDRQRDTAALYSRLLVLYKTFRKNVSFELSTQ